AKGNPAKHRTVAGHAIAVVGESDRRPRDPSACLVSAEAYHSVMDLQFTAVFRQVPEGYIGFVEELPGANTQGATLDEARTNLQEAVQLVLESNRALTEESLRKKPVIREPLASIS